MTDWVLPIAMAVFGSGGALAAIVAWRKDQRQGPIEAHSANIADAMSVRSAATDLSKTLMERVNALEDRAAISDKEIAEQNDKIAAQNEKIDMLRKYVDLWSIWYRELKANWESHRSGDLPPLPPVDSL